LYEWFTLPFDVAESTVLWDPNKILAPNLSPPLPKFGVALQLRDHDLSETQSLIRVQYEQGIKIGNRVGTAILGADLCAFDRLTPEEPPIQAFCPRAGKMAGLEEHAMDRGLYTGQVFPGVVEEAPYCEDCIQRAQNENDENVPRIQATSLDSKFSWVQAHVHMDCPLLADNELGVTIDDIYEGRVLYVIETDEHKFDGFKIRNTLKKRRNLSFYLLTLKEGFVPRVDVQFSPREIQKANPFIDFQFLESEFSDVVVLEVQNDLLDRQNSGRCEENETVATMAIFTFAFSTRFKQVTMMPAITLFDILGIIGGILSLFTFVIGAPAMKLNKLKFARALKRACDTGIFRDNVINADGTLQYDKANKIVEGIYEMQRRRRIQKFPMQGGRLHVDNLPNQIRRFTSKRLSQIRKISRRKQLVPHGSVERDAQLLEGHHSGRSGTDPKSEDTENHNLPSTELPSAAQEAMPQCANEN